MATLQNKSPNTLGRTDHRNSETGNPVHRSFTGNPFSKLNSNNGLDSGNWRRSLSKENLVYVRDFDEKENGKGPCVKLEKLRSPSMANSAKNFMSPTISASSKVAASPKKKVLAERNESPQASLSFSDWKNVTPEQSSDSKENSKSATKSSKSVRFREEIASNDVSADPDCVNLDPTFKISPTSLASLDADPSLPPYDPTTNYLSPRPRFLHYKPNPRIEQYLAGEREAKTLEDMFCCENCLDDEEGETGSSFEEPDQDSSSADFLSDQEVDADVHDSSEEMPKRHFSIEIKFFVLTTVLLCAGMYLIQRVDITERSGSFAFHNAHERLASAGENLHSRLWNFQDYYMFLSAIKLKFNGDKSPDIFLYPNSTDFIQKHSSLHKYNDYEESYVQFEEDIIPRFQGSLNEDYYDVSEPAIETNVNHILADENDDDMRPLHESDTVDYLLGDVILQPDASLSDVESADDENDARRVNESMRAVPHSQNVAGNASLKRADSSSDYSHLEVETQQEIEDDFTSGEAELQSDDSRLCGELELGSSKEKSVAEHENSRFELQTHKNGGSQPESANEEDDVSDSPLEAQDNDLLEDVEAQTGDHVNGVIVVGPIVLVAVVGAMISSCSENSASRTARKKLVKKMAGKNTGGNYSSALTRREKGDGKNFWKRESLASSEDYIASSESPSYGSFTTYQKLSAKHKKLEEESVTPVRRSSRIRKQISSLS